MKVCKDTSSVKMVCAFCAPTPPYAPVVCVVEGLSLERRNLACDPPASQTIKRGSGNLSVMRSCGVSAKPQSRQGNARSKTRTYSCVFLGLLEQRCKVLVAILLLVSRLSPFCNSFAMENQDVEKGIEKEDVGGLDRS